MATSHPAGVVSTDASSSHNGARSEVLPETQMTAERFLTIQDVCNCLNVSRTTVWRLMHEHGLRVIHIGGIRRIRQHDLEEWLERHCTSANGSNRGCDECCPGEGNVVPSEQKGDRSPR